jgi:hypothetical protein
MVCILALPDWLGPWQRQFGSSAKMALPAATMSLKVFLRTAGAVPPSRGRTSCVDFGHGFSVSVGQRVKLFRAVNLARFRGVRGRGVAYGKHWLNRPSHLTGQTEFISIALLSSCAISENRCRIGTSFAVSSSRGPGRIEGSSVRFCPRDSAPSFLQLREGQRRSAAEHARQEARTPVGTRWLCGAPALSVGRAPSDLVSTGQALSLVSGWNSDAQRVCVRLAIPEAGLCRVVRRKRERKLRGGLGGTRRPERRIEG